MTGKDHTNKVTGEEARKKDESDFQCNSCGKTFQSEAEKHEHENSQHKEERTSHAG